MATPLTVAILLTGKDQASPAIKDVNQSLGGLSTVAKGAGLAIAGVGIAGAAAAAGGIAASVKAAGDFEEQMSAVKAVSGATQTEMKQLSGLALQLGKDTSFSAGEAAAGIEELVKGGLTIPDIMNGAAKSTLALAAAGGVSLPDAATIAANALAQFNLEGSDMAHVADLIAGAANASAIDVNQFKQSLQASGAVAATVGFSFDDLAQGIAIMGKAGIAGSDAGTSLKTMMLNLQPSTDKAAAEMDRLGLVTFNSQEAMSRLSANGIAPAAAGSAELYDQIARLQLGLAENVPLTAKNYKEFSGLKDEVGLTSNAFFDASGKVKSMAEVADVLQDATKGMTEQQKLASLEILFGSDAIRAAAVLSKEGAEGFGDMAAAMGKVSAESVGAQKLDNWKGSIQALQGSLETAGITLGMAFLPALKSMTDGVTSVVNAMIPFLEVAGPKMVQMVGASIDFLRSIDLAPFMALWEAGQIQIEFFADVVKQALSGDVAGAIEALLNGVTETRKDLVESLAGWAAAFVDWLLPQVPILLSNLREFSQEIMGKIGEFAADYVEQLATWGAAFVDWIAPRIPDLLREMAAFSASMLAWAGNVALPAITAKLLEWGAAFIEWVGPRIGPLLVELGKLLLQLTGWIATTALPAIAGKLVEWGGAFLGWVAKDVLPRLPGVLAQIATAITGWIGGAVSSMSAEAARIGRAIVEGIASGIAGLTGWLQQKARDLANSILNSAKAALGISSPSDAFAEQVGEPIVTGISEGIDDAWPRLRANLAGKMSDLVEIAEEGADRVYGQWGRILEGLNAIESGGGGSGGGGSREGPNTDGQTAPSQFQNDPLYRQLLENKKHGNVPGRLSMNWADLGISYDAAMDTTRTGKPHEGKSAYYSVLYRMNTLLSNGQATSVQDAFKRAVAWVIDNTSAAGRAGLGWMLTSPIGTPATTDYTGLSEEALNAAWLSAGQPTAGPIWAEIMRRRPAQYGGARARGGRVAAGMAYTVGENGPETLFMGNTAGWVSPRSGIDYAKLAAALAQQPIVVTLNGQEVGRLVRDELVRLQRRNGTIGLVGA